MERIWLKNYDPGVAHSMNYPEITLHHLLEEASRRFPDVTSTLFPGVLGDANRISFQEMDQLANKFANALIQLGVKKGDRVALLLPNCPQFVIAYFAVLKAGGIVVATNPLYSARELEEQLYDCGAETVVTLSVFYNLIMSVRERTKLKNVVVTNVKEFLPPVTRLLFTLLRERQEGHRVETAGVPGFYRFQELLQKSIAAHPSVDVSPRDIAMLQYTGGTTGTSKGAVAEHYGVVTNVYQMRAWATPLGLREGDAVIMGVMPLFHVYGMVTVMHLSMLAGATMVLLPRFETRQVMKTIDRYKPTFFPGVPTMYVAINSRPDRHNYDFRSVRACVSGAAPLPAEVQEQFETLSGGRLVEGYGLSEAPVVNLATPLLGKRKIGSIGVPFPDTEAKLVDIESGDREVLQGEVGELCIRGPQLMREYWNRPDETALVLRDGWLHTGDLAVMDEDGFFSIVDRKKEMIIAGGFNIYPREIEEVLYEHPKVKEAVCYSVPDEYRGQNVKVCVVLNEGQTCTPEEITEYCRPLLAKYKVPKLVEFREELPKSPIGKILRRVLMEEELSRTAGRSSSEGGSER